MTLWPICGTRTARLLELLSIPGSIPALQAAERQVARGPSYGFDDILSHSGSGMMSAGVLRPTGVRSKSLSKLTRVSPFFCAATY